MLRALRRMLGVPAGLLVLLLTAGVALPAALHADANDDPCGALDGGSAGGSRLTVGSPVIPAQHCGICHWLRSLRVFHTDVAEPMPQLLLAADPVTHTVSAVARLALLPVPARAPPA